MTPSCEVLIDADIPGLNEILEAKGNSFRQKGTKRRSAYTAMKEKYTGLIVQALLEQQCIPDEPYNRIVPHITCYEIAKRRDLDNIIAGIAKFTFDALVKADVIPNDNLMHIQKMSGEYASSETGHRHAKVAWRPTENEDGS